MAPSFLLPLILLSLAGAAAAQPVPPPTGLLFVCTDGRGRTYTGDRQPPECANLEIRVLNRDGSLRQVIPAPLTPEQKAARAAEEKRKAEEAERALEQRRRDRALLETYASEAEIEALRAKTLASREQQIARSEDRLKRLAVERKKLDDEAEFYVNRKMPAKLGHAIEANASLVDAEHRVIAEMQADMERINKRFDAEARRYRELVRGGAKPLVGTSAGVPR
jgi:hypothetical protein